MPGRKPLTHEQFLARARAVHGDRYDYSHSHYVAVDCTVRVDCRTHGPFWQRAGGHIYSKQGCPRCATEARAAFLSSAEHGARISAGRRAAKAARTTEAPTLLSLPFWSPA
jgi:hypothetical protein